MIAKLSLHARAVTDSLVIIADLKAHIFRLSENGTTSALCIYSNTINKRCNEARITYNYI